MSYVMVDVESDGPIPGDYSMVSFGAVIVDEKLDKTFYGKVRPISEKWNPQALAISNISRKEHMEFEDPKIVMERFQLWLKDNCGARPFFISDNNGYDWQFINWYFWHFIDNNPFGFSSTNLGSLYKGMENSVFKSFKYLRKTKHTHNPVDDAKGNAEALIAMKEMGLKIKLS